MDTVTPIKNMKGSLLDEDYVMKGIGKVIELLVNTLEVGNLSGNLSKTLFIYIYTLSESTKAPLKATQLTYVCVTECCC